MGIEGCCTDWRNNHAIIVPWGPECRSVLFAVKNETSAEVSEETRFGGYSRKKFNLMSSQQKETFYKTQDDPSGLLAYPIGYTIFILQSMTSAIDALACFDGEISPYKSTING